MAEVEVGRVSDYFAQVGVAGIELSGEISVGDTILIKGHTTDLRFVVESMEIDRVPVDRASNGDAVGIKLIDRCRSGDYVYQVRED